MNNIPIAFYKKNGKTRPIMKSFGRKLSENEIKHNLINHAKPFKYPSTQLESMRQKELVNAKKNSDKIAYFEKYAKEQSKTWSMKSSEDDLDNPTEGAVIFDWMDEGTMKMEDEPKQNAVPLGSFSHFFESMWNESEGDVKNIDDLEIKREITQEIMEKIVERTAPKSYLTMDDGEYYLVRDVS